MNNILSSVQLLMVPSEGGSDSGSMIMTLVTFGAVFLIFYFLILRPQNKKQKETKKMLDALKKGDKIQTIGGIRGTVFSIKEDSVVVKVDDGAKIEFVRSAVSGVINAQNDQQKDQKAEKGGAKKAAQEAEAAEAPAAEEAAGAKTEG